MFYSFSSLFFISYFIIILLIVYSPIFRLIILLFLITGDQFMRSIMKLITYLFQLFLNSGRSFLMLKNISLFLWLQVTKLDGKFSQQTRLLAIFFLLVLMIQSFGLFYFLTRLLLVFLIPKHFQPLRTLLPFISSTFQYLLLPF